MLRVFEQDVELNASEIC